MRPLQAAAAAPSALPSLLTASASDKLESLSQLHANKNVPSWAMSSRGAAEEAHGKVLSMADFSFGSSDDLEEAAERESRAMAAAPAVTLPAPPPPEPSLPALPPSMSPKSMVPQGPPTIKPTGLLDQPPAAAAAATATIATTTTARSRASHDSYDLDRHGSDSMGDSGDYQYLPPTSDEPFQLTAEEEAAERGLPWPPPGGGGALAVRPSTAPERRSEPPAAASAGVLAVRGAATSDPKPDPSALSNRPRTASTTTRDEEEDERRWEKRAMVPFASPEGEKKKTKEKRDGRWEMEAMVPYASSPPSSKDSQGGAGAGASSMLLARAKAQGSQLGGRKEVIMSVDDLFGSDNEDDKKAGAAEEEEEPLDPEEERKRERMAVMERAFGSKLEEELLDVRRQVAELHGTTAGGFPSRRSEHANVREEGAQLHWPPTEEDVKLDKIALARLREEELAEISRSSRRSIPDAKRLFDAELEEQLTTLVMMMTLEAAAVGTA